MGFLMLVVTRSSGQKKQGLMRDVIARFMGLIVLAMGIQFSLAGFEAFFAA
jgi:small neutral amino acid transporter SnatA (MarC family)